MTYANLVGRHWPSVLTVHAPGPTVRFSACGMPNPRLFWRRLLGPTLAQVNCPECIVAQARIGRVA